jgi:hypothetical protein
MNEQLKSIINKIAIDPTIEGWCLPAKAAHLSELIESYKPGLIVEVGVFGGKSLIPMAMAAQHNGTGIVYGIDPWSADAALEGEKDEANRTWWGQTIELETIYRKFIQHVMRLNLTHECRWIRARSEDVVGMFPRESIEFFHLDSNHSELVSCRDVELWEPKISPRGFWVLDDSDWPTQQKAIGMIKARGFQLITDDGKYMVFRRGGL